VDFVSFYSDSWLFLFFFQGSNVVNRGAGPANRQGNQITSAIRHGQSPKQIAKAQGASFKRT